MYWLDFKPFYKFFVRKAFGFFTGFFCDVINQGFLNLIDIFELNLFSSYRYYILRRKVRKLGKYFGKFSLALDCFTFEGAQERFFKSFNVTFLKKYLKKGLVTPNLF